MSPSSARSFAVSTTSKVNSPVELGEPTIPTLSPGTAVAQEKGPEPLPSWSSPAGSPGMAAAVLIVPPCDRSASAAGQGPGDPCLGRAGQTSAVPRALG